MTMIDIALCVDRQAPRTKVDHQCHKNSLRHGEVYIKVRYVYLVKNGLASHKRLHRVSESECQKKNSNGDLPK